ncbi:MAG: PorP/SprF family type IX secretion system membrane protein [Bacteroidota bacterium]
MRKIKNIAIITLLLSSVKLFAQDPSFSQFYFNQLYFNPAFSGLSGGLNVNLAHRVLWPNLPGKFNTSKFSGDIDISGINGMGGVGILATSDVEGDGSLKTFNFGIPISIRPINFSNNIDEKYRYINFQTGFLVSMVYKSINWDKFVFSDQLDPVDGIVHPSSFSYPEESNTVFPDFAFGMVGDYQNAPFGKSQKNNWNVRAGFAFHHITQPDYSFLGLESKLPVKFVGHINFNFPLNKDENFVVAPAFVYEQQSDMQTYFFGSNILWRSLYIGGWYRKFTNTDAVTFITGLVFGKNYKFYISYSYDMTISDLASATLGSHEINLSYMLDESALIAMGIKKNKENRKPSTPKF